MRKEAKFIVTLCDGTQRMLLLSGRQAWTLQALIDVGEKGCAPISHPAPRWSAYVHDLRTQYFIDIETIMEPHKGTYPGTHGRYVLRSDVCIVTVKEAA